MNSYYVYIMSNYTRTTLYIGITNSLIRRVSEHRNGEIEGFTERYKTKLLLYYEEYGDVNDAIRREKQLKRWSRAKKDVLIASKNEQQEDLAVSILGLEALEVY